MVRGMVAALAALVWTSPITAETADWSKAGGSIFAAAELSTPATAAAAPTLANDERDAPRVGAFGLARREDGVDRLHLGRVDGHHSGEPLPPPGRRIGGRTHAASRSAA